MSAQEATATSASRLPARNRFLCIELFLRGETGESVITAEVRRREMLQTDDLNTATRIKTQASVNRSLLATARRDQRRTGIVW